MTITLYVLSDVGLLPGHDLHDRVGEDTLPFEHTSYYLSTRSNYLSL